MTTPNKLATRNSYEATATEFAQNVAQLAPFESIEHLIRLLPPKAKMIDIGCGSGRDANIFSEKGLDVLGIDFCSNLIDIAKSHAPSATFQVMDIESMDLSADTFDGAWAICSLGHIAKKEMPSVLRKIHLLLKEKGHFYLALKEGTGEVLANDSRYEGNHPKFWAFYEESEIKNLLQEAGFTIQDFKLVEKNHAYQSHNAFRIFCQKQ